MLASVRSASFKSLALSIGGSPFEDDRVQFTDWVPRKADTVFGALPLLEVDGQVVVVAL